MKNKKIFFLTVLLLILIVTGASVGYKNLSEEYSVPGETVLDTADERDEVKAPDFTVQDEKMNRVKLADFKGKPIIINFWATWCGPCKMEMPYFEEAYNQYKDKINFMMVNLTDGQRDTIDSVRNFIENNKYTFPVYYDTEYSAANAYRTYQIPVTVFIGSDGMIKNMHTGSLRESMLKAYIEELINDK